MVEIAPEGFCEDVGQVLRRWDVSDNDLAILDEVTNLVMANVDVLDADVALRVLGQQDGTGVVVVEACRPGLWVADFVHA